MPVCYVALILPQTYKLVVDCSNYFVQSFTEPRGHAETFRTGLRLGDGAKLVAQSDAVDWLGRIESRTLQKALFASKSRSALRYHKNK